MEAKVYYWKDIKRLMETGYEDKYPDLNRLDKEYVKLPISFEINENEAIETELDKIFATLNEDENPMGTPEMQQWIKDNGLKHTSMSVGDIIKSKKGFYVCKNIGWKKLERMQNIEGKYICRHKPVYREVNFDAERSHNFRLQKMRKRRHG
jgi:hypothetical protein